MVVGETVEGRKLRLAHGWQLAVPRRTSAALMRDFVRPAVRAVPYRMARQLGFCRVRLVLDLGRANVASEWTAGEGEATELAFFQQIQQIGAYLFRIYLIRALMVIPGKAFDRVDITSNRLL